MKMMIQIDGFKSVQNSKSTQMAVISEGMLSRLPYTKFQPMANSKAGSTRNPACRTKLPVT